MLLIALFGCCQLGAVCQPNSQGKQSQAKERATATPAAAEGIEPAREQKAANAAGNQAAPPQTITVVDDRTSWPSWVANIISAFLLAFVAYQAYVSKKTLQSMEDTQQFLDDQLEEMGRQRRSLSTQAVSLAALARFTKEGLTETRDLVTQNAAMVTAMQGQLRLLEEQTDLTRQSMRYAYAAYVTADQAWLTQPVVVGKRVEAAVIFKNNGSTPAYNVRVVGHISFRPQGFTFTRSEASSNFQNSPPMILGARGQPITCPVLSGVADDELIRLIKVHGLFVHVWGILLYTDVFKRDRWTQFSFVQIGDSDRFAPGLTGNEADDQ